MSSCRLTRVLLLLDEETRSVLNERHDQVSDRAEDAAGLHLGSKVTLKVHS